MARRLQGTRAAKAAEDSLRSHGIGSRVVWFGFKFSFARLCIGF